MPETTVSFEDEEQVVLRFLAKRFHAGGNWGSFDCIPMPDGCDEQWRSKLIHRLNNYGIIRITSTGSFDIRPLVCEVVDKLDNPVKPNYWKKSLDWWFSAKWRAAITIFVVLLPLLVQWIEMIRTVLTWLGIQNTD